MLGRGEWSMTEASENEIARTPASEPSTVDAIDPISWCRCPHCGSMGTIVVDDLLRGEHWGRCFKCTYFWERQP